LDIIKLIVYNIVPQAITLTVLLMFGNEFFLLEVELSGSSLLAEHSPTEPHSQSFCVVCFLDRVFIMLSELALGCDPPSSTSEVSETTERLLHYDVLFYYTAKF
jgi:hypothetical protein